jgi:hypothetical protein
MDDAHDLLSKKPETRYVILSTHIHAHAVTHARCSRPVSYRFCNTTRYVSCPISVRLCDTRRSLFGYFNVFTRNHLSFHAGPIANIPVGFYWGCVHIKKYLGVRTHSISY